MIYFDNASTSFPKAPGVGEAMSELVSGAGFNINRGGYAGAYRVESIVYETRDMLKTLFDAPGAKNVIFTPGATASINCILKGFLKPGDHVITTSMEHNAVMRPLGQLKELGVEFDAAQADPDGTLPVSRIAALRRKNTRLLIMSHASNVCGTLLPVAEAGAWARANGIRFTVDTAQTAGIMPISMKELCADALAFPGHKGLLGPQGVGGMILTDDFAKETEPLIAGGTGSVSDTENVPAFLPDRFEGGTVNLPGIAGLNASLRYLTEVGIDEIRTAEMKIASLFLSGATSLPDVRVAGLPGADGRVAVVALDFTGTGLDNADVAYRLEQSCGVMTRCGLQCAPRAHKTLGTFPAGVVRFAFGHRNTADEVERCIDAIKAILKSR